MAPESPRTFAFLLDLQLDQLCPHQNSYCSVSNKSSVIPEGWEGDWFGVTLQDVLCCNIQYYYELALSHMRGGLESSEGGLAGKGHMHGQKYTHASQMTAIEY